jgi:hypothetical protein
MSNVNFQKAIRVRNYTASAVLFENTKKDWRGESENGTGYAKSVTILPYDNRGEYGDPQEFDTSHPDFQEMIDVARSAPLGMRFTEETITEENLDIFSRSVLSNPYCKQPMVQIRQAMKLIQKRERAAKAAAV